MVNKKQTQPSKKSPVIAEPALANRPKRNISPKSWDNSSILSWREEQQLKKALYASLHPPKRQSSDPGEQSSTNEIPVCKSDETTPHRKKTRSFSTERLPLRPKAAEIRRHSSGSSNTNSQKRTDQSVSEERETRSRTRLSSNAGPRNPVKLEPQSASVTDETSQDSMISSASQPVDPEAKRKYRAQRKFAQMHGFGFGYTYTPTTTPVKQINTGSTTCRTPPIKVFPKRAKTEDFLTFLCLRGTHALPPHLDMYNFSRDDSNGADSSNPATPSNGRRPGSSMRESSPSSSSTSVSQDDNFCPITPLKNLMTPIKKAARASAGTPEIARGLATRSRHTKNSQRTAFGKTLDVTPNSSPGKRKSPLKLSPKGSPAKMAKSDRIKMKKKAVATLTTLDKRSRKKSLFNDGSEDTLKKKTSKDQIITRKIRNRLKPDRLNIKRKKKSEDYIASRLPPRKARHSDMCLYVETEDLDDSSESKSPTPVFEPEKRKRKIENRIDVDDEISLKVPIKQSRLFKNEMKSRKPRLKENILKSNKISKLRKKKNVSKECNDSPRISTRSLSRSQPESNFTNPNVFVAKKLKKLKKFNQEKREQKTKTISEKLKRKKERKEKQEVMDMSDQTDLKSENLQKTEIQEERLSQQDSPVVRKKNKVPGKKPHEEKVEPDVALRLEQFPGPSDKASIVDVPVYNPTEEEFSDPIGYLRRVASMAESYGMCKIIPSANWKVEGKLNEDIRFVTQRQIINKLYQRFGPSSHKMECIQDHLESHGIIESPPVIGGIEIDLGKLSMIIKNMGGMQNVTEKKKWQKVADVMGIPKCIPERGTKLYEAYCRFLVTFDTLSEAEKTSLEEKVKESMTKKGHTDSCCLKGKNMTLSAFNKMSKNIETAYISDDIHNTCKLEKEYWDIVEERNRHVVVHCGCVDTHKYHCSGFSAKKDAKNPWNLNKLHQKPGSVLQYLGPLQGVTIPSLHIGMLYSTSCWSTASQLLPWVQYLHTGGDVIWYSIPLQEIPKFHEAVKEFQNENGALSPNSLMIPPSELNKRGVSVSRCVQKPREFVVVFPQCYSTNVSCGNSIAESVCYALPDWLSAGLSSSQKLDGTEKEPFSMDELLCKIVEDSHASKELLSCALPVFQQVVDKELSLRSQLQEAGLKMSRRMCTDLGHIKTSPGGTSRCMDDIEEIVTFCETSKKVCYLSMVLNEADDLAFRPEHGLQHIQKKRNIKSCIFMYRHTNEELREMIFNATERLKSKDTPDSASKRKRKSV